MKGEVRDVPKQESTISSVITHICEPRFQWWGRGYNYNMCDVFEWVWYMEMKGSEARPKICSANPKHSYTRKLSCPAGTDKLILSQHGGWENNTWDGWMTTVVISSAAQGLMYTIFICFDAHALIDAHSSPNCSRTWKFLCYFFILQPSSGTKFGSNMEISKLCMHNSSQVSLLYQWVRAGVD